MRHSSPVSIPALDSFRTPTICSSMYRLFFIRSPRKPKTAGPYWETLTVFGLIGLAHGDSENLWISPIGYCPKAFPWANMLVRQAISISQQCWVLHPPQRRCFCRHPLHKLRLSSHKGSAFYHHAPGAGPSSPVQPHAAYVFGSLFSARQLLSISSPASIYDPGYGRGLMSMP